MYKNTLKMIWMVILVLTLFGCQVEPITLDVDVDELTLKEGETYTILYETNDSEGLGFESSNTNVVTIDSNGVISAIAEGEAEITLYSTLEPDITHTIVVTVRKLITLDVDQTELTIIEGDTSLITYESNDQVTFISSDASVFTIDDEGTITAVAEGTATLTIRSTYDEDIEQTIDVEVRRRITITLNETAEMMWVGEFLTIDVASNGDLSFTSLDPQRATVDSQGRITAIAPGPVTIEIKSLYDPSVSITYSLTVNTNTESIVIDGLSKMNIDTDLWLIATSYPAWSLHDVTWTSSDDTIATVIDGVVTAHQLGVVTITATSIHNPEVSKDIEITIVDTRLVDDDPITDLTYAGIRYQQGETLFQDLETALTHANPYTTIYVKAGTYAENVTVTQDGIKIIGIETGSMLSGELNIDANDVWIQGITFQANAKILATSIEGLTFTLNVVQAIFYDEAGSFMSLTDVKDVDIIDNQFIGLSHDAIKIDGIKNELNIIDNIIHGAQDAIHVIADPNAAETPNLWIYRNIIRDVDRAFVIMPSQASDEPLQAIIRFNVVENYTLAVLSDPLLEVDFTLNAWGTETPDPNDFEGIDMHMIRGYYTSIDDIPLESSLRDDVPLAIEVQNPIDEIVIGETHTILYGFLPMEFETTRIRFLTSDPDVLGVTQEGVITPLRSGTATITVRSSIDSSVLTTITIVVTTTPGIDFEPTQVKSNILVGDQFMLNATPFPISYASELISYDTSDPLIATVDSEGVITTHGEGTVIITASMVNHPDVENTFTFNVYNTLDTNNLMDLLTAQQVVYSTPREWRVYGVTFDFIERRYDSVSRYHFGEIPVNTSKIVPVSVGIRPGEGFSPHPEGITQFNPYNVYWVVVHETANTSPGAGALSHANYLWNLAAAGSQPFVSWHFTVDSELIYQHLPETERGYHAGDGSVLPGQSSTYLGGGNRNGIGIEMAVNQDGDMYRTWQRTAKLATHLLVKYNLPLSHLSYHIDFSGKMCPQSTIRGGMIPLFEAFAEIEYLMHSLYADATITLESHNPDLVDNTGRVLSRPDRGQTVSYTITIDFEGSVQQRTFYTYLPGTVK